MAAGGGYVGNNFNTSVEVYLPASSKWQDISGNTAAPFAQMFYANQSAVAAQFSTMGLNSVYVAGGAGNETTLQMYDTTTKTFDSVSNTTGEFIDQAGSVMLNDELYVFGGYKAANVVGGQSERYDPSTGWANLALLTTARRALAGVVGPDGTIYALGGHGDGTNDTTLDVAESYVTQGNQWIKVPAATLPQPREDLAATTGPDGRIYVMGGLSGGATLNSVVAYTPSRTHWTSVKAAMGTKRSGFGAVTGADGLIYAIGGADGSSTPLNSAEFYGPKIVIVSNAVQGSNFAATAAVTVYDGPIKTNIVVGTGTTGADGTLLAGIPLSSLSSGAHVLTVMDNHSRYPVTTTYTAP
jgi:N-acetylneuraminic acid mutarotase